MIEVRPYDGFPVAVPIKAYNHRDAVVWLIENDLQEFIDWVFLGYVKNGVRLYSTFRFRKETYGVMFKLRWGDGC